MVKKKAAQQTMISRMRVEIGSPAMRNWIIIDSEMEKVVIPSKFTDRIKSTKNLYSSWFTCS